MLEELSEDASLPETEESPLLVQGQGSSPEEGEETASFFAEATRLPFTHDLARGNLCAFVAGRPGDADLTKVTVMSVLSFNPGMRVAVAAEDGGLGEYER